jgi:hypothetical protein
VKTGQEIDVVIQGKVVAYSPTQPMPGISLLSDPLGGFQLGPSAFESTEALAKTVLHEMYRNEVPGSVLRDQSIDAEMGGLGGMLDSETSAAASFANRAFESLRNAGVFP